jgi:hypothetical protein
VCVCVFACVCGGFCQLHIPDFLFDWGFFLSTLDIFVMLVPLLRIAVRKYGHAAFVVLARWANTKFNPRAQTILRKRKTT